MRFELGICLLLLTVSGCASTPDAFWQEHHKYQQQGSASLIGNAGINVGAQEFYKTEFYKTEFNKFDLDQKTAASHPLSLFLASPSLTNEIPPDVFFPCMEVGIIPKTSYYETKLLKGRLTKRDLTLIRKAPCSPSGDFAIKALPEGDWFFVATIPTTTPREATLISYPHFKNKKTKYWVMSREANTRSDIEDEIFLYASSSEYRQWDAGSFLENHQPPMSRLENYVFEKEDIDLFWGLEGDK